ncbi:hypothetical protein [Pedobacter cryoconitis]|uniref:Uncharacterized protein n=1 Tax=Pedobacter cryoconitis TaxID=188932 RepID=A0A327SD73_9SPHI|nr:hypothetical protein [Pedobacter cryoconitis]RAJ27029.1 hypothetical protein LY11_03606 [Pedobacter cryoconitis]
MSILLFIKKSLVKFLPLNAISADPVKPKTSSGMPAGYRSTHYKNDASLIINAAKPISMNIDYGK